MKLSQIDRAIQGLEGEMKILQTCIDKLRATQAAKPKRERKAKAAEVKS